MVASASVVNCTLGATLHLGADCQFDIGDAGSGVKYILGPGAVKVRSPQTLSGLKNPGQDIIPGVLEPIGFGTVEIQFLTQGAHVLRGFPTGFGSGAAGVVDVTINVGAP